MEIMDKASNEPLMKNAWTLFNAKNLKNNIAPSARNPSPRDLGFKRGLKLQKSKRKVGENICIFAT